MKTKEKREKEFHSIDALQSSETRRTERSYITLDELMRLDLIKHIERRRKMESKQPALIK